MIMHTLPDHGGDIYQAARELGISAENIYDFSTNANEFARALTQSLVGATPYPFDRYPDPDSVRLRECIARHEGVKAENILVGNGSAELIFLALQAMRPSSALLIGPIFMEYARACQALKIPFQILPLSPENGFNFGRSELAALWRSQADLAILCTPNNPTGVCFDLPLILDAMPCQRLLTDNTYREFMWDEPGYAENCWLGYRECLRPGASVLCLNSFTKFFHCAGVRLGYLVADRAVVNTMAAMRAPWTVSAFAQELGCRFLEQIDEYRALLPELRFERHKMISELLSTGLFAKDAVFPGPSFITLGLRPGIEAMELKKRLLKRQTLIRVCDNIPGMPPNYVRIQVRPAAQTEPLLDALNASKFQL
ncbi:MAG: aminotransferase class I/II-fold pyridoxal phosphate-dependent enzyme [Desulfovibrionaceae bacterium]|nr:aminotransferase class I/II-fold pyridoxal phosphate-dependent enzyme [Desulfovibrionaceae bacterium]